MGTSNYPRLIFVGLLHNHEDRGNLANQNGSDYDLPGWQDGGQGKSLGDLAISNSERTKKRIGLWQEINYTESAQS
jgi:hypothetical protein